MPALIYLCDFKSTLHYLEGAAPDFSSRLLLLISIFFFRLFRLRLIQPLFQQELHQEFPRVAGDLQTIGQVLPSFKGMGIQCSAAGDPEFLLEPVVEFLGVTIGLLPAFLFGGPSLDHIDGHDGTS